VTDGQTDGQTDGRTDTRRQLIPALASVARVSVIVFSSNLRKYKIPTYVFQDQVGGRAVVKAVVPC